jgi:hypothetical protein
MLNPSLTPPISGKTPDREKRPDNGPHKRPDPIVKSRDDEESARKRKVEARRRHLLKRGYVQLASGELVIIPERSRSLVTLAHNASGWIEGPVPGIVAGATSGSAGGSASSTIILPPTPATVPSIPTPTPHGVNAITILTALNARASPAGASTGVCTPAFGSSEMKFLLMNVPANIARLRVYVRTGPFAVPLFASALSEECFGNLWKLFQAVQKYHAERPVHEPPLQARIGVTVMTLNMLRDTNNGLASRENMEKAVIPLLNDILAWYVEAMSNQAVKAWLNRIGGWYGGNIDSHVAVVSDLLHGHSTHLSILPHTSAHGSRWNDAQLIVASLLFAVPYRPVVGGVPTDDQSISALTAAMGGLQHDEADQDIDVLSGMMGQLQQMTSESQRSSSQLLPGTHMELSNRVFPAGNTWASVVVVPEDRENTAAVRLLRSKIQEYVAEQTSEYTGAASSSSHSSVLRPVGYMQENRLRGAGVQATGVEDVPTSGTSGMTGTTDNLVLVQSTELDALTQNGQQTVLGQVGHTPIVVMSRQPTGRGVDYYTLLGMYNIVAWVFPLEGNTQGYYILARFY